MKKTLSYTITILFSLVFAFSFAVVTRFFRPAESVNALWLVTAAGCFFVLIYRLYGAFLSSKVLNLNDSNKTPAFVHEDGKDYHPTNRLVLFGHHFAARAASQPEVSLMYRIDAALVGLMALLAMVAVVDSVLKWRQMIFGAKFVVEAG